MDPIIDYCIAIYKIIKYICPIYTRKIIIKKYILKLNKIDFYIIYFYQYINYT